MHQPLLKSLPESPEKLWPRLHEEARTLQEREPALARYAAATVVGATHFAGALGNLLAEKLAGTELTPAQIRDLFAESHKAKAGIDLAACQDLVAIVARDPAAGEILVPFLFYKGFHALQAYRLSHWMWRNSRKHLALYIQNRVSDLFGIDIHPAARIGSGIMMDHATGIVIGETAVVENDVSMLHGVTLGGTGKQSGDRHPKIRSGVMIGAGAKILGNIEVGAGARIAAGSVVLQNIPACKTAAGVPARVVGDAGCAQPAREMDQLLGADSLT
ncbi:MAG: serine O-acetyltransferase [Bdellovibrionales bacterium]